ncbi:trichohyalin isoform X1 [Dendroctonus ponderosae]|uniref:trichohyalin isoform X1 n=1 Tax=Dendroctonus ponderosae TaxID=77166 RepID=UPI002034D202|nr:trichohyalin isoform X1 [Dendroctonus ponderosae]
MEILLMIFLHAIYVFLTEDAQDQICLGLLLILFIQCFIFDQSRPFFKEHLLPTIAVTTVATVAAYIAKWLNWHSLRYSSYFMIVSLVIWLTFEIVIASSNQIYSMIRKVNHHQEEVQQQAQIEIETQETRNPVANEEPERPAEQTLELDDERLQPAPDIGEQQLGLKSCETQKKLTIQKPLDQREAPCDNQEQLKTETPANQETQQYDEYDVEEPKSREETKQQKQIDTIQCEKQIIEAQRPDQQEQLQQKQIDNTQCKKQNTHEETIDQEDLQQKQIDIIQCEKQIIEAQRPDQQEQLHQKQIYNIQCEMQNIEEETLNQEELQQKQIDNIQCEKQIVQEETRDQEQLQQTQIDNIQCENQNIEEQRPDQEEQLQQKQIECEKRNMEKQRSDQEEQLHQSPCNMQKECAIVTPNIRLEHERKLLIIKRKKQDKQQEKWTVELRKKHAMRKHQEPLNQHKSEVEKEEQLKIAASRSHQIQQHDKETGETVESCEKQKQQNQLDIIRWVNQVIEDQRPDQKEQLQQIICDLQKDINLEHEEKRLEIKLEKQEQQQEELTNESQEKQKSPLDQHKSPSDKEEQLQTAAIGSQQIEQPDEKTEEKVDIRGKQKQQTQLEMIDCEKEIREKLTRELQSTKEELQLTVVSLEWITRMRNKYYDKCHEIKPEKQQEVKYKQREHNSPNANKKKQLEIEISEKHERLQLHDQHGREHQNAQTLPKKQQYGVPAVEEHKKRDEKQLCKDQQKKLQCWRGQIRVQSEMENKQILYGKAHSQNIPPRMWAHCENREQRQHMLHNLLQRDEIRLQIDAINKYMNQIEMLTRPKAVFMSFQKHDPTNKPDERNTTTHSHDQQKKKTHCKGREPQDRMNELLCEEQEIKALVKESQLNQKRGQESLPIEANKPAEQQKEHQEHSQVDQVEQDDIKHSKGDKKSEAPMEQGEIRNPNPQHTKRKSKKRKNKRKHH